MELAPLGTLIESFMPLNFENSFTMMSFGGHGMHLGSNFSFLWEVRGPKEGYLRSLTFFLARLMVP